MTQKPVIRMGGKLAGHTCEWDDRIELVARGGQLLGTYWKRQNQTLRPGGTLVGYGDLLMTLLEV